MTDGFLFLDTSYKELNQFDYFIFMLLVLSACSCAAIDISSVFFFKLPIFS